MTKLDIIEMALEMSKAEVIDKVISDDYDVEKLIWTGLLYGNEIDTIKRYMKTLNNEELINEIIETILWSLSRNYEILPKNDKPYKYQLYKIFGVCLNMYRGD